MRRKTEGFYQRPRQQNQKHHFQVGGSFGSSAQQVTKKLIKINPLIGSVAEAQSF
jgi:uncharacterized protein (DUF697 family)